MSISPIEDARLRFFYVDETVKFYNEQGREFNQGANFYFSNRSAVKFYERFVITADPEFSVVENKGISNQDTDINLRFHELNLSTRFGPADITVGRVPLWWGPGRHGSLILSNNARPFDMVKLSTAGPILLPWYFKYLGLIRGETFLTELETSRAVSHPYMWGMRVSSRIFKWLEFGGSRTAMFGGKHRSVDLETIAEVITGSTENDIDDPGNQIATLDARVIIPWSFQPIELYGEIGGEDEAGGFFSREAYLTGFYLPRIGPSNAFEFTFEFTQTAVNHHPRTWYTNKNFPDGYTYYNEIMGHHVGTDGLDLFFELRMHPPILQERDLSVLLSYDFERHFQLDPVEENLHQIRVALEITIKKLKLYGFLQHDEWENFRQVRGKHERGNAIGMGATWEF